MSIRALIPVKRFGLAKSRLATVLDVADRARLAEAMLRDTLSTLNSALCISGISVITADSRAAFVAGQFGAQVVNDRTTTLNAALEAGRSHARSNGDNSHLLILPADLPAMSASDVQGIAETADGKQIITIVSAHDGDGTNAIFLGAGVNLEFAFGLGSFRRHVTQTRRLGIEPRMPTIPGIAADLDRPEDIPRIMAISAHGEAIGLLKELGIVPEAEFSEAS